MSGGRPYRIGMIVPSSNTTMETEIPALLRRREEVSPERFTFHSARMRMQQVTEEQLREMDDASVECAVHLSDARRDVLAVGRLDPGELPRIARRLTLDDVDVLVLSACVQMPSLPVIGEVERELGLPVLTAATATARQILTTLRLDPAVPDAGRALAGDAMPAMS